MVKHGRETVRSWESIHAPSAKARGAAASKKPTQAVTVSKGDESAQQAYEAFVIKQAKFERESKMWALKHGICPDRKNDN